MQPALLVEPINDSTLTTVERAQFLECIWPLVQEANKESPAHAQVLKTHIMFTFVEKTFKRAGKGTVQRASTVEMYSQQLDALYADADKLITPSLNSQFRDLDVEYLMICLVKEILKVTGWEELLIDENLFVRGMDSLQVLALTRQLRHLFCGGIAPSTVYANFTVKLMARAVQKLLSQEQIAQDNS